MINGNILKFGYGDISVHPIGLSINFTPFKPPVEVGTDTRPLFANGDIEPIGETISIFFDSFSDLKELQNKLDNVHEQRIFEFKGYMLDFSNFNIKSIEIIERARQRVYYNYLQCAAC